MASGLVVDADSSWGTSLRCEGALGYWCSSAFPFLSFFLPQPQVIASKFERPKSPRSTYASRRCSRVPPRFCCRNTVNRRHYFDSSRVTAFAVDADNTDIEDAPKFTRVRARKFKRARARLFLLSAVPVFRQRMSPGQTSSE